MAVTPVVTTYPDDDGARNILQVSWTLTSADPTGVGYPLGQYADAAWHFTGTWGAPGATAAAQGSHTDTDGLYASVKNAAGAAAITATGDSSVMNQIETPHFARPKLTTAGTGATVVAVLRLRRQRK